MTVHYHCAAVGCNANFGDPEVKTLSCTNFVSWACYVFNHYEHVHGRTGKWNYDDVNSLIQPKYKDVR